MIIKKCFYKREKKTYWRYFLEGSSCKGLFGYCDDSWGIWMLIQNFVELFRCYFKAENYGIWGNFGMGRK